NSYAGGTILNSSGTGLVASQYSTAAIATVTGINFTALTPTFTRIDPTVNYPSNTGFVPAGGFGNPPTNPAGLATAANALVETGYLNIVIPGNYTFQLVSDDGGVV